MSEESLQLVTFHIGKEEFGIDITKVQEINRMIEVTRMPNTPSYIEGAVNLRGKIIPIVNLRKKLGLGLVEHDKSTRIMVVEVEGKVLGFIVDSVSEVLRIQDPRIEAPPSISDSTESAYIEGVINLADRILMLLDLDALFGQGAKGGKLAA